MKQWLRNLVEAPERVRRRAFWIILIAMTPLIVGVWIFSMQLSLNQSEKPVEPATLPIADFRSDVVSGFTNVKNMLQDVNLEINNLLGSASGLRGAGWELKPVPERPRIRFKIEE